MKNVETVADTLANVLSTLDVNYLFGVSGANIETLHDAVVRLNSPNLENILCKSESGAAFMADGYARHKKINNPSALGVCCSTSGGGMLNLAVGVAEARASGIPMLALVGCPPTNMEGQGAFQDASGGIDRIDGFALWSSITKYTAVITTEHFWQQLFDAIQQALNGFCGPSALLLPKDVMEAAAPPRPTTWPINAQGFLIKADAASFTVLEQGVTELIKDLKTCKKPLIVAGADMQHSIELQHFCDQSGIPVVTTLECITAFPNSHPRHIGSIGVAGHRSSHDYLQECDLILSLGSQLEGMTRAPFESTLKDKKLWIVNRSISNAPNYPLLKGITSCPNLVIKQLNERFEEMDNQFSHIEFSTLTREPAKLLKHEKRSNPGLTTSESLAELQPHLTHFSRVFMDAGNCAASAAHYFTLSDHTHANIALGMGGMGYAICATIGAQLAGGDGRSLVICGDGAFLMSGMEIHTAIERQLPILWVIFNDSQHGMCTSRQRFHFNSRITCSQYSAVDFQSVAKGLAGDNELWTARVQDPKQLDRKLAEYFALPIHTPGVVELIINKEEIPPFFPLSVMETTHQGTNQNISQDGNHDAQYATTVTI
ncbi:MAG: acetolactate synthase [Moraxellaceae bacterium]|nr:MAG: acetolactate synthase [Moraxellaceae bacterium]